MHDELAAHAVVFKNDGDGVVFLIELQAQPQLAGDFVLGGTLLVLLGNHLTAIHQQGHEHLIGQRRPAFVVEIIGKSRD